MENFCVSVLWGFCEHSTFANFNFIAWRQCDGFAVLFPITWFLIFETKKDNSYQIRKDAKFSLNFKLIGSAYLSLYNVENWILFAQLKHWEHSSHEVSYCASGLFSVAWHCSVQSKVIFSTSFFLNIRNFFLPF